MSDHEVRLSDEHRRQMAVEHLRQLQETMAALGFQVSVPDERELGRLQRGETNWVFVAMERVKPPTVEWHDLRDQLGLNASMPHRGGRMAIDGRKPLLSHLTLQRYSMPNRPDGWNMGGKVPYPQMDPAELERILEDLMPVGMMPTIKLAHYILMKRPEVLAVLMLASIFAAAERASRDNI